MSRDATPARRRPGAWLRPMAHGRGRVGVPVCAHEAGDIGPRAFAIEVEDESMVVNPPEAGEVSYLPGDLVICDPDAACKPGDLVIARRDRDAGAVFRTYAPVGPDEDGNELIELVPLNADWPTVRIDAGNPGHIAGKVVRHQRVP